MGDLSYLNVKVLQFDNEIDRKYARIQPIGSGAFGQIYEVKDLEDPRQTRYAMKIQERGNEYAIYGGGPHGDLTRLLTEILILNRILPKHPNIITLKDILISPQKVYIVTELCEKGIDMKNFCLVANNTTGRRAFQQLAKAIQILHLHGVAHCDMKSNNILFKDANFMELKLIDFGVSRFRPEWATEKHDNFDHTMWFRPEELQATHMDLRYQDILSLGRTLHGIICGMATPIIMNCEQLRNMQIIHRPRTTMFDAAAMDLLCKIGPEPFGPSKIEDMLTVDQILDHPWFTWLEAIQWCPPEPSEYQLNQNLEDLHNDLTILQRLLREWLVIRFTILPDEQSLNRYYEVLWRFQRGDDDTRTLEVVDHLTQSRRMEMRLIFGRMLSNPEIHPGGFEIKDPMLIYIELLIMLRILPSHENIISLKSVYVNKKFVAMVREPMEGHTMIRFFEYYARNSISRRVFKKLAQVVHFMHQHGVVLLNLHPQHIVWKTLSPNSYWKIVDLSKARYIPEMAINKYEKFQPRRYLTYQLMELGGNVHFQTDITALGRILHAMMAGRWEPDPTRCANILPRTDMFDDAASDLLSMIGPMPFGPPERDRTVNAEDICHHSWFDMI